MDIVLTDRGIYSFVAAFILALYSGPSLCTPSWVLCCRIFSTSWSTRRGSHKDFRSHCCKKLLPSKFVL